MKRRLLDLLLCPRCLSGFRCTATKQDDREIWHGTLRCVCGSYPVSEGVPRLLAEHWMPKRASAQQETRPSRAERLLRETRDSFGYQWTAFGKMTDAFEKNFLSYVAPIEPSFFPGKLGLDAGCGFGRHMYYAAKYGAEMVGLDASRAIDVARRNAAGEQTHFVQGDLLHPPFRPGSFDFAYCIGVLHHLPDPEAGFQALQPMTKEGAPFWIWVYSKRRRFVNAMLETARVATKRMPFPLLKSLCFLAAVLDYGLFIAPSRRLRGTRLGGTLPPRLRLYAEYPFQVCYADWFDRLSAPVRFYYDETDLEGWAARAGWSKYRIEPTGLYGFRLQRQQDKKAPCVA